MEKENRPDLLIQHSIEQLDFVLSACASPGIDIKDLLEIYSDARDTLFLIDISCGYLCQAVLEKLVRDGLGTPATRSGSGLGQVYAMLMDTSLVKIGFSGNAKERVSEVEAASGSKVVRLFSSPITEEMIARKAERLLQQKFASSRTTGEYFRIRWEDAVEAIGCMGYLQEGKGAAT